MEIAIEICADPDRAWRRPRLAAHLLRCADCRAFLHEVRRRRVEISEVLSELPPDEARARTLAAIDVIRQTERRPDGRERYLVAVPPRPVG